MAMKVYKTGEKVAIEKDANPIFFIPVSFASVRIVNENVTVLSILDATVSEFDTVANIQDSGGTPIGNLTDVVKYLNGFIFSGSTTTESASTPSGGEINDGVNVGLGEGVYKQKTGVDLEFKTLIGGTNVTITNNANDLTIDASGGTSEVNIVNVLISADLPSVLLANTVYIVNGSISTNQAITTVGDNSAIIGRKGRNTDVLTYTGTGTFITISDANFTLRNITLSATDSSSLLIAADNYNVGDYNEGRDKTISIFTCQFRNCFDVMDINGFDLVDINNTLFFYVTAQNKGIEFRSTSKIELSSCELIRWFNESSIPVPSGYAIVPMVSIVSNGIQDGVGAVNISGCIFHPQQTQDAIKLDALSTTGFGTISSNTFIDIGITTGILANFDYSVQNTYIIQANQGIANGNALATMSLNGNVEYLDVAGGPTNPIVFKGSNCIGGSFTNPITFPISNRVITNAADCSLTYNSKIQANFFVSVSATVERGGDGFIVIRLRQNGVAITSTFGTQEIRQSRAELMTFTIIGQATFGDVFDLEIESQNTSGVIQNANVLVRNLTLNGYQF